MILTGKCKKDFENWLIGNPYDYDEPILYQEMPDFYNLPKSFQYGVYVDFFDSVKIMIELQVHTSRTMQGGSFKCIRPVILSDGKFYNVGASFGTRERARTAAIKKVNEIYNLK